LNVLFDDKPSRRYMLVSEGSKYFLVYLHGSLRIAGIKGLRIARHERKIIHRHRNCVRLRFCFIRDKENTGDNECEGPKLRHQKRIACPLSGIVSGEFAPKSQFLSNLLQSFSLFGNLKPAPSTLASTKATEPISSLQRRMQEH
jgi:hypothetical protein